MLTCQQCGALISHHDAEGGARIAGDSQRTLCPACAVALHPGHRREALIRELWGASTPEHRCPHVSHDGRSCRCGAMDQREAELVCDTASLQLWCLDGQRYPLCMFFPQAAD